MTRSGSWVQRSCICLAAAPVLVGTAYVLGRLKLVYYFGAFGVDLPPGLGLADLLFESWFVLQNALFVLLMWWVALVSRRLWVGFIAVFHALLPILAHYAFLAHERPLAGGIIEYRHTLLKLLPFGVLILAWLVHPGIRPELRRLTPPLPPAGMALFAVVLLAWSLSAAKHFGSYDAQRAMRKPDRHLTRVSLFGWDGKRIGDAQDALYRLHAGPEQVVVWDHTDFRYGISGVVRILTVPAARVERRQEQRTFDVQPGGQFL